MAKKTKAAIAKAKIEAAHRGVYRKLQKEKPAPTTTDDVMATLKQLEKQIQNLDDEERLDLVNKLRRLTDAVVENEEDGWALNTTDIFTAIADANEF